LATEEARKQNQSHVKAEHIFLGLLREGGGVAAVVLKNLGVRLESARAEVLKEISAHPEAG
jgi:ATP-dependent Clp protease ATP-binding subunit ClpC